MRLAVITLILAALVSGPCTAAQSTCFGTVSNGRLEGGVKLPELGANFTAYSSMATKLGRSYVHSRVAEMVVSAYRELELTAPGKVFVYGETGWADGGRLRPHRTHQNGLSVDFMVPVVDAAGRSVALPTEVGNKFGYDIEFDANAKYESLSIDFEAMAEHLYLLDLAAKQQHSGLALVIFEPSYLPKLFNTKRGAYLRENINFMKGKAWVRHDEHYHVDFSVACKPRGG